jgi:hypothetical protein
VLWNGDRIVSRVRKYDNDRFESVFPKNGQFVYNKLISTCRDHFIRYLNITDEKITELFDECVVDIIGEVDRDSEEFAHVFNRIRDWRKNWFHAFIKPAEGIMNDLKDKYNWSKMPVEQLKVLYQSKFSYEYVFQLMSAVHAGTIDWRESLKNEWINNLWRTIFTFTMM